MPVGTVSGLKLCCKCGKDVTHVGRMKGSDGRYWCVDCGSADEGRKGETAGGNCVGCGEGFSKPQLTHLGGRNYCHACAKVHFAKKSVVSRLWSKVTGK